MKIVDQPFKLPKKEHPSRLRRVLSWLYMPIALLVALGRRLLSAGRWLRTTIVKRGWTWRDGLILLSQILLFPLWFIYWVLRWIAPRRRVRSLRAAYQKRTKGRFRPIFARADTLSIRRRLPLTYALVALVATVALSVATVTTLNSYYDAQQYQYLNRVGRVTVTSLSEDFATDAVDAEALTQKLVELGNLTQTRMRLVDEAGGIIADSGGITRARIVISDDSRFSVEAISLNDDGLRTVTQFDGLFQQDAHSFDPHAPQSNLPIPNAELDSIIETLGDLPGPQPIEIVIETDDRSFAPVDLLRPREPFTTIQHEVHSLNRFLYPHSIYHWRARQPITLADGSVAAYLELSGGPDNGSAIVETVTGALAFSSFFAILLAAFVGWRMSRRISQPILALADTTGQMAEGDLSVRAEMQREDEIGRLAQSFNLMAERVENTVDTLRQFVGDAAHELNTPITALRNTLDVAAEEAQGNDSAELATLIDDSRQQIERLETLTQGLLNLSRLEADEPSYFEAVNVANLILKTSELYAAQAEQVGLEFWLDLPELPAIVMGDERQLKRAISNLIENAIKFTPEGGTVTVGLTPNQGWLRLWVLDTGIGIPEDEIEHIFGRFNRARNTASIAGNGLGLAMVKAIAEQHGGFVSAENAKAGTLLTVSIPLKD